MSFIAETLERIPSIARPFLVIPVVLLIHALVTADPTEDIGASARTAPVPAVQEAAPIPARPSAEPPYPPEEEIRGLIERDIAFNEPLVIKCIRHDPNDSVCADLLRRRYVEVTMVTDRALTQLHDIRWELTAKGRSELHQSLRESPQEIGLVAATRAVQSVNSAQSKGGLFSQHFSWTWKPTRSFGLTQTIDRSPYSGTAHLRFENGRWRLERLELSGARVR